MLVNVLFPRNISIQARKRCILIFKSKWLILQYFSNWNNTCIFKACVLWHFLSIGFAGKHFFTYISLLTSFQSTAQKCPSVCLYWSCVVIISVSFHIFISNFTRKGKPPRLRDNSVFMITSAELCCVTCDLTGMVQVSNVPIYF